MTNIMRSTKTSWSFGRIRTELSVSSNETILTEEDVDKAWLELSTRNTGLTMFVMKVLPSNPTLGATTIADTATMQIGATTITFTATIEFNANYHEELLRPKLMNVIQALSATVMHRLAESLNERLIDRSMRKMASDLVREHLHPPVFDEHSANIMDIMAGFVSDDDEIRVINLGDLLGFGRGHQPQHADPEDFQSTVSGARSGFASRVSGMGPMGHGIRD